MPITRASRRNHRAPAARIIAFTDSDSSCDQSKLGAYNLRGRVSNVVQNPIGSSNYNESKSIDENCSTRVGLGLFDSLEGSATALKRPRPQKQTRPKKIVSRNSPESSAILRAKADLSEAGRFQLHISGQQSHNPSTPLQPLSMHAKASTPAVHSNNMYKSPVMLKENWSPVYGCSFVEDVVPALSDSLQKLRTHSQDSSPDIIAASPFSLRATRLGHRSRMAHSNVSVDDIKLTQSKSIRFVPEEDLQMKAAARRRLSNVFGIKRTNNPIPAVSNLHMVYEEASDCEPCETLDQEENARLSAASVTSDGRFVRQDRSRPTSSAALTVVDDFRNFDDDDICIHEQMPCSSSSDTSNQDTRVASPSVLHSSGGTLKPEILVSFNGKGSDLENLNYQPPSIDSQSFSCIDSQSDKEISFSKESDSGSIPSEDLSNEEGCLTPPSSPKDEVQVCTSGSSGSFDSSIHSPSLLENPSVSIEIENKDEISSSADTHETSALIQEQQEFMPASSEGQNEVLGERSEVIDEQSAVLEVQSAVLEVQSEVIEGKSSILEGQSAVHEGKSAVHEGKSAVHEELSAVHEELSEVLEELSEVLEVQSEILEEHSGSESDCTSDQSGYDTSEELASDVLSYASMDSALSATQMKRNVSRLSAEGCPYYLTGMDQVSSPLEDVLHVCEQDVLLCWEEAFPIQMLKDSIKIGEGVYGEVFKAINERGESVALKVIPIEGSDLINEERQKTLEEILPEILIAQATSQLRMETFNSTPNFVEVKKVRIVQGVYPDCVLAKWDEYAQRKVSENDRPDIFPPDQLFIIFEFGDGGQDLEAYQFKDPMEGVSVLNQVVWTLAIAEQALEFEHRDLHIGNILVKATPDETIEYVLKGERYSVKTFGVKVFIIDFTNSRLRREKCTIHTDLSTDDAMFEGPSEEYQFDIYREMKRHNCNEWKSFQPFSNILWVHYLMLKLIQLKKYGNRKLRKDCKVYKLFSQMERNLLDNQSCYQALHDCPYTKLVLDMCFN